VECVDSGMLVAGRSRSLHVLVGWATVDVLQGRGRYNAWLAFRRQFIAFEVVAKCGRSVFVAPPDIIAIVANIATVRFSPVAIDISSSFDGSG